MLSLLLLVAAAMPALAGGKGHGKKDVVSVAGGTGQHATLVTAIKAAQLEDTLRGIGPYTVFAPTDAAFAKLPPGALDDLLKPENRDKLRAVLLHHVVAGKVMSSQAMAMDSAHSLNGTVLTLENREGRLYVSDAAVELADVEASNGIIHVVDTVMLPPGI
jgi:uncharacterized surface protein with fasciclin (FAS1) repeats